MLCNESWRINTGNIEDCHTEQIQLDSTVFTHGITPQTYCRVITPWRTLHKGLLHSNTIVLPPHHELHDIYSCHLIESVRFRVRDGLCKRRYHAWISYTHVMHCTLVFRAGFITTPVPSIISCANASYHLFGLFHLHAQVITFRGEQEYRLVA